MLKADHPSCENRAKLISINATTAIIVTRQVPNLQVNAIAEVSGKRSFFSIVIRAGNMNSVAIPDVIRIEAMNIPTVRYGISGANSSGKNPMPRTAMFLRIALAGSPKRTGIDAFQDLCSL